MSVRFPLAATVWLAPGRVTNLLVHRAGSLNPARSIIRATNPDKISVCAPTLPEVDRITETLHRYSTSAVVAKSSALPFTQGTFSHILLGQDLLLNQSTELFGQASAALVPSGTLSAAVIMRDDSVPWVTRLAKLVQRLDPRAMRTPTFDITDKLASTATLTDVEHKSFRLWVPCTLDDLLGEVRQATTQTSGPAQEELLGDVQLLYETVARPPEPLMLPYRIECWRARSSHQGKEFASAMSIRLSSPNPGTRL